MVVNAVLDRVFIRLDKKDTATDSGIILPETYHDTQTIGTVESIGEAVKAPIKVGDRVLFHVFDELPSNDPDVVVVRECSILGVFYDE